MREEKITLPLGAKKETSENQEVMLAAEAETETSYGGYLTTYNSVSAMQRFLQLQEI